LVTSLLIFEHEKDGTTQFVGEDGKSLGFTVFTGEFFQIPFGRFVAFEEENRGLGESPLEMSVADLFTAGSVFFTV